MFAHRFLTVAILVLLAPTVYGQESADAVVPIQTTTWYSDAFGARSRLRTLSEPLPGYDTKCELLAGALCTRPRSNRGGATPVAVAPIQNDHREGRGKVALRGLFWGAVIGGLIGYFTAEEYFGGERWFGAAGGVLVGAPVGMVVYLLITPL